MKNKELYFITTSGNAFERVKKWCAKNKMVISGILLCILGIIACAAFPEDAMGGVFCVMMGIPTFISGIADWRCKR